MAIAGIGIRQSQEFHARADPVYTRENPARSSGDASSSTTETIASRAMYCRNEFDELRSAHAVGAGGTLWQHGIAHVDLTVIPPRTPR
jgi:hypothetical protein